MVSGTDSVKCARAWVECARAGGAKASFALEDGIVNKEHIIRRMRIVVVAFILRYLQKFRKNENSL